MALKSTALEIFKGLADSYDRVLDAATVYQDRYWKRWLIDHAGIGPRDRVLDIGCGTCVLEERLAGTGASVVGVDITAPMLRSGQLKRLTCVELLVLGDADSLPFRNSTFDVVVSCYVPKYVSLPSFASEIARVLKPGGRTVVYDFVNPRGWLAPFIVFYDKVVIGGTGTILNLARRREAFTFQNISWIVEETSWDDSLPESLEEVGVHEVTMQKLTGGVVGVYSGVKA